MSTMRLAKPLPHAGQISRSSCSPQRQGGPKPRQIAMYNEVLLNKDI